MITRFRHRRVDEATRQAHRETKVGAADLIWPVFLVEGTGVKDEVASMPGVFRYSVDRALPELAGLTQRGLRSVLLFGVPPRKGIEQAWSTEGIVQAALPRIRAECPTLEIITDVCLCSYTPDGHCHVGDNDETCEILARIAVSYARAGADMVAPSAMMDGQVLFIRKALDGQDCKSTRIMSYAAKFASSYYGPFRDAADCTPHSGDRQEYQMDPANGNEALEEIAADVREGAAEIIVKPALAYLDVISRARRQIAVPIVAYNVSGEYAMLTWAVSAGGMREDAIPESLLCMKRAGADRIITYFVPRILGVEQ